MLQVLPCIPLYFMGNCAKAQTCKLSLKVSGKRENSVTTWMIPHKRKNSCSISWSSILMWSSRTRQPDKGSLQRFSEFGTLASVKRLLKLGVSTHEALQWCTAQKAFQHLFTEKHRQRIRTGEWSSCLAQESRPCSHWLPSALTGFSPVKLGQ